MYAPPQDRSSPLLVELARLQQLAMPAAPGGFEAQLASVRNEVAHYAHAGSPRSSGLVRRTRLQGIDIR